MRRRRTALWPADPTVRLALLVSCWAVTRFLVTVVPLSRDAVYPSEDNAFDTTPFELWTSAFLRNEGPAPLRDGPWEYPAAAAVVLVAPGLLRGAPYLQVFVQQMVLFDLALLLLLALWGMRRGSWAGAWLWLAAVPLLGPVALARFDVVPTLLAAAGLVASAAAAPAVAGVLLATGAAVKVWPGLLVPIVLALQPKRLRLFAGGAAIALFVVILVAWYGQLRHLLSFLTYQQDRGLEVEAVPALPLMILRLSHPEQVSISFGYGAWEVQGPGDQLLLTLGQAGMIGVALLTALLTWRARQRTNDRGQAAVVLAVVLMSGFLLFDKVLSAQYPLWLAGLVALALCWRDSPLRGTALPLLLLLAVNQLVYPIFFDDLLAGRALPVNLLIVRDLLLALLFVQASRAAWSLQETRSASEHEVPVDEEQREQAEAAG